VTGAVATGAVAAQAAAAGGAVGGGATGPVPGGGDGSGGGASGGSGSGGGGRGGGSGGSGSGDGGGGESGTRRSALGGQVAPSERLKARGPLRAGGGVAKHSHSSLQRAAKPKVEHALIVWATKAKGGPDRGEGGAEVRDAKAWGAEFGRQRRCWQRKITHVVGGQAAAGGSAGRMAGRGRGGYTTYPPRNVPIIPRPRGYPNPAP
jgi:hypothetical protein